jgi:hypothetical protein
MSTPNRPPVQSNRRDPVRTAAGKAVVLGIADKRLEPGSLALNDLTAAIYYLDGTLFLPLGGAKAGRLLRAEAKKRGIL